MKLEKAELDAEIEVLRSEGEAAAAEAQADVLEAVAQKSEEHHIYVGPLCKGPKTALNARLALRLTKLQCKPGRTQNLRGSKAGSISFSQPLLRFARNAPNARSTSWLFNQAPSSANRHAPATCGAAGTPRFPGRWRGTLDARHTARST